MNKELYDFLDAINAWYNEVNSTLFNVAEQQKQIVDAFSDLKTMMIEMAQDKVNELQEQIEQHDCKLSRDSGCDCVELRVELERVQETLNKL